MMIYADCSSEELICVDSGADPAFWDGLWANRAVPDPRRSAAEFTRVTRRYLPRGARILEGGTSPFLETAGRPAPESFYQFMLNPRAVTANVQRAGFDLCQVRRRSAGKGIDDDLPRLAALFKRMRARWPYLLYGATRFFLQILLRPWCGHSTLTVARKAERSEKIV